MTKLTKIMVSLSTFVAVVFVVNTAFASDTESLQPASPASAVKVGDLGRYFDEYNSYMQLDTALHSSETMHLPDIHIGSTEADAGGVTYFNGTIRNIALDENGEDVIPVTFGDDVRIDGAIWRGASQGTADNMPVKIADSVVPALTNVNDFGSTSLKWQDGFFNGTVWMTKLGGNNVVTEENLSATNTATTGYALTYASDGRFTWTDISAGSSSGGDGDWTIASNNMYAGVSGNVGIASGNAPSSYDGKLDVEQSSNAVAVRGESTDNSGAVGVEGEGYRGIRGVASDTTNGYSGDFQGGNFRVALTSGENFIVNNLPNDVAGDGDGAVYYSTLTGEDLFYQTSSIRYKENVRDLDIDTAKVLSLRPVKFDSKISDKKNGVGFIAEEVAREVPDLATIDKEGRINGVKYDKVAIYLLGVIKEQQAEIDGLKAVVCKQSPQEEVCQK